MPAMAAGITAEIPEIAGPLQAEMAAIRIEHALTIEDGASWGNVIACVRGKIRRSQGAGIASRGSHEAKGPEPRRSDPLAKAQLRHGIV